MNTESRRFLQHLLASIAYRTQKALRGAPREFADFRTGLNVRTPHEIVWHMTGLMGYARTMLNGGEFAPPRMPTFVEEVQRFHATLLSLHQDFVNPGLEARISDMQFLQGPLADAMTHVGQVAMLRRLQGVPVPSENFIFAKIDTENVSTDQAEAFRPDPDWAPDKPPPSPGPNSTSRP